MTTFESSNPAAEPAFRERRGLRVFLLVGVILVVAFVGVAALVFVFGLGASARTKVTPSKATTYVTGPLRADGSVDYLAALNARSAEGVTLDNNASVLLWQALGPLPLADNTRDEFFQALGIPTPPEAGDYFLSLDQFVLIEDVVATAGGEGDAAPEVSVEELENDRDEAMTRPWTEEEFPALAKWLKANEAPLALVAQASHRPRRYDPIVTAPDALYRLIYAELPMAHEMREFARALTLRAMQRVSQGQIDEAWQDLLAVHRLSRLAAQGPTLVDGLVGIAINREACSADRALLQYVKLRPEQVEKIRAELDQVVAVADVVDKIDVGERCAWLDSMASAAQLMSSGAIDEDDEDLGAELADIGGSSVDWNRAFAETNIAWNRYMAACREPNRARRDVELARLDEEFKRRTDDATSIKARMSVALRVRAAVTEYVAMVFYNYALPGTVSAACNAQDRGALDLELTKLAFAIAAYQADHGRYPRQLAELVPRYLAKVPDDVFTGNPVRYTVDDAGYVLHSYGADGEDNASAATNPDEVGDDVIVRILAASQERQE